MNPSRLYLELDVRHNVELMYDISIVNVYLCKDNDEYVHLYGIVYGLICWLKVIKIIDGLSYIVQFREIKDYMLFIFYFLGRIWIFGFSFSCWIRWMIYIGKNILWIGYDC
jgi:hypothetical protein